MPTADEIRDGQRATWGQFSAGWEKWDPVIVHQLGPVGAAIIESLAIANDQQHLDVAAGTGEPGLSVARLAPDGRVVLTDLAPEMLEVAKRRAAAQGITNIETQVCSVDDLPFDDATFDSISVRFGYMFFPDHARATAELARVLKPGGRVSRRCGSTRSRTRGPPSRCRPSSPRSRCPRPIRMRRAYSAAPPRGWSTRSTKPRVSATCRSGTSPSSR